MSGEGICKHGQTQALMSVHYMMDTGLFMAEITIKCVDCGMPFQFMGLPAGISVSKPSVDPLGFELRVPIKPYAVAGPIPDLVQQTFDEIQQDQKTPPEQRG